MKRAPIERWLLLALAILGVIGVVPIVWRQWTGLESCPAVGSLPACYIAFLGYSLIAVSAFSSRKVRVATFLIGFVPIFGLALAGSGLEMLGHSTCPTSASGTPMCFYSLGLAVSMAALFILDQIRCRRHLREREG